MASELIGIGSAVRATGFEVMARAELMDMYGGVAIYDIGADSWSLLSSDRRPPKPYSLHLISFTPTFLIVEQEPVSHITAIGDVETVRTIAL